MKRVFKILTIGIGLLCLTIFIYERYFLTKWYYFTLGNIKMEVMSDECETCFLDWPINHTIWIESEDSSNGKFELYTEGPRLEFGFNTDSSELIINCPGFSNLFIDLKKMKEIDVPYEQRDIRLENYEIQWVIKKNKEIIKLDSLTLPNKGWEEN